MDYQIFAFSVLMFKMSLNLCAGQSDHFENVALNKACNMSSNRDSTSHPANAAVNGNIDGTYLNTKNCIHTNGEKTEWWEVNLARPYPVNKIVIWARTDFVGRMKDCVILVDGEECYRFEQAPARTEIHVNCTRGIINGTVVRVLKRSTTGGEESTINICEFEVWSCSDDYWSSACDKKCGQCNGSEVCDKVTGYCPSCAKGWLPPFCDEECLNGSFGFNCRQTCSNGCVDVCNKITGYCTCKPGFKGPACDTECLTGKYGVNCSQNCSTYCVDNTCNKSTGQCICHAGVNVNASECISEGNNSPLTENIAVIAGSVAASVVALIMVTVVLVIAVRRRRDRSKKEDRNQNIVTTGNSQTDATSSPQVKQDVVYQNVTGAVNNEPTSGKSEGKGRPKTGTRTDKTEEKNNRDLTEAALGKETHVNSAFDDSDEPVVVKMKSVPLPPISKTAVVSPLKVERNDDQMGSEDVDEYVVRENGQGILTDRVHYYNDDVYMTSEGANLKLDSVQQHLLDKLRADVINAEFKVLPVGLLKAHDAGSDPENYYRNRFNSILPYDDTRVVLQGTPDPGSNDYINASYIKGHKSPKQYIAAQGPKPNTLADFWKMVWQEQITHLVMLTNLSEGKKKKCEEYWPAVGEKRKFGSVDVTGLQAYQKSDYCLRTFDVKKGNQATRHVTQYQYVTWPDHGIPTITGLVDFWRTVMTSYSAGVGRTGTFIALDILMNQTMEQIPINVLEVVKSMRNDRCNMIQTQFQYRVLHEALLEAYTSQDCRLSLLALDTLFPSPIDPDRSNTHIDREFEIYQSLTVKSFKRCVQKLKQMKVLMQKPNHTVAKSKENIGKNRCLNILPDDSRLVHLSLAVDGRNSYINAVRLPTFGEYQSCFLTQLPLSDTAVDLWRLVVEYNVCTVISLAGQTEKNEPETRYWPSEKGQRLIFGPISVHLNAVTKHGPRLNRFSLSVHVEGNPESKKVELFQSWNWSDEKAEFEEDVVHLLDVVLSDSSSPDRTRKSVVVQCTDGATRSGLFCALYNITSAMTADREVDVYMAVRKIHIIRPECITKQVQYRYLYRLVQDYKRKVDVYCNT